jgi:hypothetical protein
MERAKAALSPEALAKFFGPGGEGMAAFEAALKVPAHPLVQMVAIDEEIEAAHRGWMNGDS